jgi:hypothetical protein
LREWVAEFPRKGGAVVGTSLLSDPQELFCDESSIAANLGVLIFPPRK